MTDGVDEPATERPPDDPRVAWPAFASAVEHRLELGESAYEAKPAARRPLPELADEMMGELEDVAGWAVCLWTRLRHLRSHVNACEPRMAESARLGRTVVLGLDLSVTAAAAVAVPLDWDGRWPEARSLVVGEKLRRDASDAERAQRTERIASQIVSFARQTGGSIAFIESYAFGQATAAHTLGEVGGVVRLELLRSGIDVRTAPMSSSRKLLLGKVPRQGAKEAVFTTLRAAGAPFATADEADAFVACQWGLAELGGYFFGQA